MTMQVENTTTSVVRAGSLASHSFDWSKDQPKIIEIRSPEEIQRDQKKRVGISTGIGLGTIGLLGAAFKDGASEGFNRLTSIGSNLSYLACAAFSIGFPLVTLEGERANFSSQRGDTVDLFTRMTYTAASLGFNPQLFIEPLKMMTRSPAYAVATLMNLPHILFTMLSYVGGRSMGFLSAIKKFTNTDSTKNYRLEQEFESWYQIGNLGSTQASVVPMAGQFIMGWGNIIDAFKGDFGSIKERFKEEPISAFLGTVFNTWAWPFEYVAKYFDTTIRVAEQAENIKGAFGENTLIMKSATNLRDYWHTNVKNKTPVGKFLKGAREFAKVESLIGPPIGMASVVLPAMNKFVRGEFTNPEAQEIGGIIGAVDKVFGCGAFLGHCVYTISYGLFIRFPQVITGMTFYGARLMNAIRGIDVDEVAENFAKNPNYVPPKGYVDPTMIRTKIFKPLMPLSNAAGMMLDKLEKDIQDKDDWWLIDNPTDKDGNEIEIKDSNGNPIKGRGNTRHIRGFAKVVAQDNVFKPIREKLYSAVVAAEINNIFAEKENEKVIEAGKKPTDAMWAYILKHEQYDTFLEHARERYKEFLRTSHGLDEDKVEQMFNEEYTSEGAYKEGKSFDYNKPMKVEDWVMKLLDNEINKSSASQHKKDNPEVNKQSKDPLITSKSLWELATKPKELIEVLKLKTFHITNTILPFWLKGFVQVVDYGEKHEAWWKRNLKAQITGIQEGDIRQACDREFLTVVNTAYQNATKGFSLIHNSVNWLFSGKSSTNERLGFFS